MMEKFISFIKKNKKIVIVAAVALIIVIIVAISASNSFYESIDDDYFVSDGSKLVLTLPKKTASFETSEYEPDITHVVYYYSGDDITSARVFFAYNSEEEAREADKNIKSDDKDWMTGRKLNGKYIIFNTNSDFISGLTASFVKKAVGFDEDADSEDTDSEEANDEDTDAEDTDLEQ
jgi:hypothetical protein